MDSIFFISSLYEKLISRRAKLLNLHESIRNKRLNLTGKTTKFPVQESHCYASALIFLRAFYAKPSSESYAQGRRNTMRVSEHGTKTRTSRLREMLGERNCKSHQNLSEGRAEKKRKYFSLSLNSCEILRPYFALLPPVLHAAYGEAHREEIAGDLPSTVSPEEIPLNRILRPSIRSREVAL